eukprot:NODE_3204_length_2075_cov_5.864990.p1 GENE.NODE_3204_length_2075_cov_5.864990~~NODE_3204_length_2075_cov_5.864990.p1  ORF type:complete len:495 (-),score=128.66 NODE_3204_length_2075_cov_5.864990:400-1884(-)
MRACGCGRACLRSCVRVGVGTGGRAVTGTAIGGAGEAADSNALPEVGIGLMASEGGTMAVAEAAPLPREVREVRQERIDPKVVAALVNRFVADNAEFLQSFARQVEARLQGLQNRISRLERLVQLFEQKTDQLESAGYIAPSSGGAAPSSASAAPAAVTAAPGGEAALEPVLPSPEPEPTRPPADQGPYADEKYAVYKKMHRSGVPLMAIRQKLMLDQLQDKSLDMAFIDVLERGGSTALAPSPPPPAPTPAPMPPPVPPPAASRPTSAPVRETEAEQPPQETVSSGGQHVAEDADEDLPEVEERKPIAASGGDVMFLAMAAAKARAERVAKLQESGAAPPTDTISRSSSTVKAPASKAQASSRPVPPPKMSAAPPEVAVQPPPVVQPSPKTAAALPVPKPAPSSPRPSSPRLEVPVRPAPPIQAAKAGASNSLFVSGEGTEAEAKAPSLGMLSGTGQRTTLTKQAIVESMRAFTRVDSDNESADRQSDLSSFS